MPTPILDAFEQNHPILGGTIKGAIAKAFGKAVADPTIPLSKTEAAPIAEKVVEELSKDKAFVNATNSELWWQSGVAWGLTGTQIGAAAIILPQITTYTWHLSQYDWGSFLPAALVVSAGIFGLIRRFYPGLKPLFPNSGQ